MSLIPSIKFGIWNAWILALGFVLIAFIIFLSDHFWGGGELYHKMGEEPVDKEEKRKNSLVTGILIFLFLLSVVLPIRFNSVWFYLGGSFWVSGVIIFACAMRIIARTSAGGLFNQGIYRFSRHPLYLSLIFILLGIGLISASWLFLLGVIGFFISQNSLVAAEENECLKVFGDEYKSYMKRTPRWLGIPKT